MTAAAERGPGEVLMITPGATRVDTADDGSELVWPEDGRCITLSRKAVHILSQFAIPSTTEGVATRLERTVPGSGEVVRRTVEVLVEAGALCPQAAPSGARPKRHVGLFGAPVVGVAEAVNSGADFVVIGAPYDHGASYRPGSRFAPEALRRLSTTVFQADEGRHGMFDAELGGRLLADVGITDIGDVVGTPGAMGQDVLDGLEDVVALTARSGKVPVVLGGDHSITLRVVDGLTRHHERIGVLHFDAHHDYGRARSGGRDNVHHGNFLDWVVGSEAVACVAQFGIRQLTRNEPEPSEKLRRWPGQSAVEADPAEIVRQLPQGLRWHLSFDVDVLDPAVMPSTGTVLPGGYTYRQALSLATALCDRLPVVGLDIVEYLPSAEESPGVTVAGLLVRTMHYIAVARRRLS